jgi:hypothetical protein
LIMDIIRTQAGWQWWLLQRARQVFCFYEGVGEPRVST